MNTEVIQRRFNDFKSRFSQLFGSNNGYEELDTLERPLVSDMDTPLYEEDDGGYVAPGGGAGQQQRQQRRRGWLNVHVPSQQEELAVLTVLSKDAAEILWEMVLLKEDDGANVADVEEMRSRSEQLRAQLRGMLNDYDGNDEVLMCRALEAWDSLNSALDGDETGAGEGGATDGGAAADGGGDLLGLDAVDAVDAVEAVDGARALSGPSNDASKPANLLDL